MTISERQKHIIDLVTKNGSMSAGEIFNMSAKMYAVSKITLNRDLRELVDGEFLIREGSARATRYKLTPRYKFLAPISIDAYFEQPGLKRTAQTHFNFSIFDELDKTNIFLDEETQALDAITKKHRKQHGNVSSLIEKRELERFVIEFSWKSSSIEGDTYTLLETEELIQNGRRAPHKKESEAIMILNHKKAFDYIFSNQHSFNKISIGTVEHMHQILTDGLNISRNIRTAPVGITGTEYLPLDNQFQIREALEKTCKLINSKNNPFEKSLVLMSLVAYIQPFEDGNKRTSRLMGNAVLMANQKLPLSYRTIDEVEYKKAIILFFEQNNLLRLKELFIEQYKFVANNYFAHPTNL